jgi:pilus assembly protein Flp/PilA
MTSFLKAFLLDDEGATAIEYGLIAALVSVAAIVALQAMSLSLRGIFNDVATAVNSATGP